MSVLSAHFIRGGQKRKSLEQRGGERLDVDVVGGMANCVKSVVHVRRELNVLYMRKHQPSSAKLSTGQIRVWVP